ncbi:hypothetical protein CWC38_03335, partial [Kocuria tytonicola]
PPHDPTPGAPRSGKPSHPRGGNDTARVRFAAVAAALAVLASALVNRDVLATWLGVALAVAGVVMGIVALVRARGATSRGLVIALGVIAVLWGTLNTLGGASRLLVWPATQAYQECTDGALTLASQQHCQQQLNDNVFNQVGGRPLETGGPSADPTAAESSSASPGASGSESPSGTGSASPSRAASTGASAPASASPSGSTTPSR